MNDKDPNQTEKFSIKIGIGALASFFLPFICAGSLVSYWVYQKGQNDVERWSHFVQSSSVPFSELIITTAIWFCGAGLVAGICGLSLYILTCHRS